MNATEARRPSSTTVTGRTFLSTTPDGVARMTEDEPGDDDWVVEEPLTGHHVRSLAAGPAGSDLVVAGTDGGGVVRSTDRGETWEPLGGRLPAVLRSMVILTPGREVSPRSSNR
jgi:photosystem II stability/assembly factor-like uncharacterized protein